MHADAMHRLKKTGLLTIIILGFLTWGGCYLRDIRWWPVRPPRRTNPAKYRLLTTGYCACGQCCNWRRTWYGRPVIASGPNKGKPKKVGYTASGTRAKPGTIAADTNIFPFGTIMYIPGYGYGRVEDLGGSVKDHHIDLFFRHHKQALKWGRHYENVKVWLPK